MHGNINLPTDRSNSLGDLAARIAEEHEAVALATRKTLTHAIAAGELLIEAKPHIKHGEWGYWLREKCKLPPRSATKYAKLARGRAIIESQIGLGADLTINTALRLLRTKNPEAKTGSKAAKSKPAAELTSLSWSDAPESAQQTFVDAIGLRALYAAAPPDHQQKFRDWLLSQEAPAITPSLAEVNPLLPGDDLSIPAFLRRAPETGAAA
jgi:Protein of unknown function (DUF3102)